MSDLTDAQAALPIRSEDGSGNLLTSSTISSKQALDNNLAGVGGTAVALGQTTASASIPVTIASNQPVLAVTDGLHSGGVYGALSIPTAGTAVEAKVGASRLTSRKFLQIYSNNNGLFWGLDSSVTTSTGTPLSNGQTITFSIDPSGTFQVWLVGSANSKTVQVVEAP